MNSPTIAAVVPGLPKQAGSVSTPESEDGPRFADVLAGQASGPRNEAGTATPGKPTISSSDNQTPSEGAHASAARGADQPDEQKHARDESEDLHALPQIALEIAAHARGHAVRNEAGSARMDERGRIAPAVAQNQTSAVADRFTHDGNAVSVARDVAGAAQAKADAVQQAPADTASKAAENRLMPFRAEGSLAGAAIRNTVSAHKGADRQAHTTGITDTRQDAAQAGRLQTANLRTSETPRSSPELAAAIDKAATLQAGQANPVSPHALAAADAPAPGAVAFANPFSQANAAAAVHTATLSTPVHSPGWNTDLGRQVVSLARDAHNGVQTAELRLDPPDLGPLRISISLNDGMASAMFVSAHASVRQAIESALPQLSQQLAQAGISLGETHVGDQGQADSAFGNDAHPGQRQGSHAGSSSAMSGTTLAAQAGPAQRSAAAHSLVDTFA